MTSLSDPAELANAEQADLVDELLDRPAQGNRVRGGFGRGPLRTLQFGRSSGGRGSRTLVEANDAERKQREAKRDRAIQLAVPAG